MKSQQHNEAGGRGPAASQAARCSSLLNRSAVRQYILDRMHQTRPSLPIERVSAEALDRIEAWLRQKLDAEIHSHPSVGKTFRL